MEVPFTTLVDVARAHVPLPLPLNYIMRDKYDNISKIKDIHTPLLVMGGLKDKTVPVELAKELSNPFPFVRVDFYEIGDKVMLGEMTFYPGGGLEPFTPEEWDYKMGEYITIPEKIIEEEA